VNSKITVIPGVEISINRDLVLSFLAGQILNALQQQLAPGVPEIAQQNNLLVNHQVTEERAESDSSFTGSNSVEPARLPLVAPVPELPAELQITRNDFAPRECKRSSCKKLFVPINSNHFYCVKTCSKAAWLERQKEKTEVRNSESTQVAEPAKPKQLAPITKGLAPRICARPLCSEEFTPTHPAQRFCNNRCSQNFYSDKNREKSRERARAYQARKRLASQRSELVQEPTQEEERLAQ